MKQSLDWRIFALVIAAGVLRFSFAPLFWGLPAERAPQNLIDTIGMIGLIGHAFGVRIWPLRFWRVFAAIFALWYAYKCFNGLPEIVMWVVGYDRPVVMHLFLVPAMGGFAVALIAWALALFRYGGWLAYPLRTNAPQPKPRTVARIAPSRQTAVPAA